MKTKTSIAILAVAAMTTWHAGAQIYDTNNNYVQIFAGSGQASYLEAQGTLAMFNYPSAVVVDTSSNLFVIDSGNRRIRKITPDGDTSAFVGGGAGSLPGYGTSVSLGSSFGAMVIDHSNIISIACRDNRGTGGLMRIYNNGYAEFLTFPGMNESSGLCVDSGNNLYFSTSGGNQIFRLAANGTLTFVAGNGSSGTTDGNGFFASFYDPRALAVDAAKNVYVWDAGSHLIRRIDQSQNVTSIAGSIGSTSDVDGQGMSARFSSISAMTVDNNGNVIMACGSSIRKMSASTNVTTIAGSFSQYSYANGLGALARFNSATGVWLSQGMMWVADSGNHRIRQISSDPQPQVVADSNLGIHNYAGITITGLVGRTYQIQSSPDTTNWTPRATLLLTASPYLWFDLNPISGNKFYRALLLP